MHNLFLVVVGFPWCFPSPSRRWSSCRTLSDVELQGPSISERFLSRISTCVAGFLREYFSKPPRFSCYFRQICVFNQLSWYLFPLLNFRNFDTPPPYLITNFQKNKIWKFLKIFPITMALSVGWQTLANAVIVGFPRLSSFFFLGRSIRCWRRVWLEPVWLGSLQSERTLYWQGLKAMGLS